MAGTKVIMTHAQRQAFLKTSGLGEIFGVAHLLPEIEIENNVAHIESENVAHKLREELIRMSLVRDRLRINIFTFKTRMSLLAWLSCIFASKQDDRTPEKCLESKSG